MLKATGVSYLVQRSLLLSEINLEASAGRLLAIIGPNGAGKSTLLRIMAGEIKPTSGSVHLDGEDIADMKPFHLASRRAVVPQATHLAFPFSAAEVVALGQSVPGFSGARRDSVISVMDRAGILDIADRSYQALSGGERQRVHFARALCQLASSRSPDRQALLLDEATSNLDLAHQLQVLSEARRLTEQGSAVIAVLHDWNLAAQFADDVALMSEGRIAAIGRPSDIFSDELLTAVFKCQIKCNKVPPGEIPFILPQLCSRITVL